MDLIDRQIARAGRLLWTQSVLNIVSWCLIVAFSICFFALLVPKIWFLPYTFRSWSLLWMTGCAGGAALVAGSIAFFYRPSRLYSAIELDRRFGLRERISSALQMVPEDRESPIGEALIRDAAAKAERIDVRDHFPIKSAPQTPWVLLPLLSCFSLFWVPDAEVPVIANLAGNASTRLNNIKNQTKPILAQIKKQREALEEKGLQDAADEFKRIEKKLEDLQKTNTLDSKKLLSDFNEIKKEIEQRKDALGGTDSLKKALDNLKNIDKGPADKIADALKDGDIDKAGKELDKLLEQMKSGNLSDAQKQQLTKQLEQMQKAIEKSAEEQKKAVEETKKELANAEKSGDAEAASKLQKKLEQLEANANKGKAAQAVKAQMQKAQKAMEQGNEAEAQQALEELQAELAELAEDEESLQEMESLMDELQSAKKSSTCSECDGNGCAACKSDKEGKPKKNAKGEGRGAGDREEEESNVKHFDSQVREQMRKGETVYGGKVGGPNRKGVTQEDVRNAVLNATPDDPDAIENMSLPKAQRDQQRDYFDSLRDR
jgi:chemotaxis protein histidine kinase CheA